MPPSIALTSPRTGGHRHHRPMQNEASPPAQGGTASSLLSLQGVTSEQPLTRKTGRGILGTGIEAEVQTPQSMHTSPCAHLRSFLHPRKVPITKAPQAQGLRKRQRPGKSWERPEGEPRPECRGTPGRGPARRVHEPTSCTRVHLCHGGQTRQGTRAQRSGACARLGAHTQTCGRPTHAHAGHTTVQCARAQVPMSLPARLWPLEELVCADVGKPTSDGVPAGRAPLGSCLHHPPG